MPASSPCCALRSRQPKRSSRPPLSASPAAAASAAYSCSSSSAMRATRRGTCSVNRQLLLNWGAERVQGTPLVALAGELGSWVQAAQLAPLASSSSSAASVESLEEVTALRGTAVSSSLSRRCCSRGGGSSAAILAGSQPRRARPLARGSVSGAQLAESAQPRVSDRRLTTLRYSKCCCSNRHRWRA